jgi:hypothetical protein
MAPGADRKPRKNRTGVQADDAGIAIRGRGILVALFAWPFVALAVILAVVGVLLVVLPGTPVLFRISGLLVVPAGSLGAFAIWFLLLSRPRLSMRIYRDEIRLFRKGAMIDVIERDAIGCLVRWDTLMYVFDSDDQLTGEWELGWAAGIRSEQLFKRAMKRYDYPSRIFFCRPRPGGYRGSGGPSEFVETGRTGAMERELGRLTVGDKWVWPGDAVIQPGPGLSAGPMAEYVAALEGHPLGSGSAGDSDQIDSPGLDDPGIAIAGGGRLVAVYAWPCVVLGAALGLFGLGLAMVPGAELGFRLVGVGVGVFGSVLGACVWLTMVRPERMNLHIYPEEIVLLRKGDVAAVIDRDAIGCLVRWGAGLYVFDRDDRLTGEWELGWPAGAASERAFQGALSLYDYPSRSFLAPGRSLGRAGAGVFECARTGAMTRELGPLPDRQRGAASRDRAIQPGPGLSDGPMAAYVDVSPSDRRTSDERLAD